MKEILQDYLELFGHAPVLNKKQRQERHRRLQQWMAKSYDLPATGELIPFLKQNAPICSHPFAEKVILPNLVLEYRQGGTQLFAFLCSLGLESNLLHESLTLLCGQERISPHKLMTLLTERDPENTDFLRVLYQILTDELYYCVHELPIGILDESDPSPDESDLSLCELAHVWQDTARKLGLDKQAKAKEYLAVFHAWEKYLKERQLHSFHGDFETYLTDAQIPWQNFFPDSKIKR